MVDIGNCKLNPSEANPLRCTACSRDTADHLILDADHV